MLKIKDNVDLKELEKFGFYICKSNYVVDSEVRYMPSEYHISFKEYCNLRNSGNAKKHKAITIKKNRGLLITKHFKNYELLYDLIKADLVEKSDGNE